MMSCFFNFVVKAFDIVNLWS